MQEGRPPKRSDLSGNPPAKVVDCDIILFKVAIAIAAAAAGKEK